MSSNNSLAQFERHEKITYYSQERVWQEDVVELKQVIVLE